MTARDELLETWRGAREGFKLDGKNLTAKETAGLLIEQLGGVEPALRLAKSNHETPFFIEVTRPHQVGVEVIELLSEAWWAERLAWPDPPTREWLAAFWESKQAAFDPDSCEDALIHAAGIVTRHDNLPEFVQMLGRALYSPLHVVGSFASRPCAAEVLFLVDMVSWRDQHLART